MSGDCERAKKHRQADMNFDSIRGPATAGRAGEEIALERSGHEPRPPQRIERKEHRSPALTWSAKPQRDLTAPDGFHVEGHFRSPIDLGGTRSEPHGSKGRLQSLRRMPEGRSHSAHRAGSAEASNPSTSAPIPASNRRRIERASGVVAAGPRSVRSAAPAASAKPNSASLVPGAGRSSKAEIAP